MRALFVLGIFLAQTASLASASEERKITIPPGFATVRTDESELKNQLTNSGANPEWYADETPKD